MQKDENGYIIEQEELEQEYESSYFLMLTYDVLTDQRLTDLQKLLYAAITGLCKQKGYCWASNAYFEKLFNKSTKVISNAITTLVELGYLKREIIYKRKEDKNGQIITTKQIAFRKLSIILNRVEENTPIVKNDNTPMMKKDQEINNNLINNISSNNIKLLEVEPKDSTFSVDGLEFNFIDINNGECINDEIVSKMEGVPSALEKGAAGPAKKKGGIAPHIDLMNKMYAKDKYPKVNQLLMAYLKCHINKRRMPTIEKWADMLNRLEQYASIELPGTIGNKFVETNAIAIVERAINAKGEAPYPDFDDIYHTKERLINTQFNVKGY